MSAAAMTMAAAQFGAPELARAQSNPASSFGALKQIDAGVLNVGYADVGPSHPRSSQERTHIES
jgi:hypothetical protein